MSLLIASRDMEVVRILAPTNATGMAFYRLVIVLSSVDVRAWISLFSIAFWCGRPKPV